MSKDIEIYAEDKHTDDMVKAEVLAMLGADDFRLTLGAIETLWLIDSPYTSLEPCEVKPEDVIKAYKAINHGKLEPMEFHAALVSALETAWRAYEIVAPDPTARTGRRSEIRLFAPEWLADTMSQACAAMPSLTYNQVLWEMPLTLVLHLAVSTARRNGAITERPKGVEDALRQFREMRRKKDA